MSHALKSHALRGSAANPPPVKRRRRRRRALILSAFFCAYFLLVMFSGVADWLVLYPTNQPISADGAERIELTLPSGRTFEVWKARSPGAAQGEPVAFALEFVGNASRAETMAGFVAREWRDRPVEVWAVNYAGYGGSPGPARLKSIPPTALAAYDALRQRANRRPIFVTGQSLGTTAALHVAANRPVAGCVLWSPPPLAKMIFARHGWWNLWLLATPVALAVPSELDSPRNAGHVNVPAVFIATGADTVVPLEYQTKVFDAYAGQKRFLRLPGSQHNALLEDASIQEYDAALQWLWDRTITR
jgi:uncharacterized protein